MDNTTKIILALLGALSATGVAVAIRVRVNNRNNARDITNTTQKNITTTGDVAGRDIKKGGK